MLLPDKDGIYCDFCGTSYRDKFSYYSTEATVVNLTNSVTVGQSTVDFNKDMCEACYDKLIGTVRENLDAPKRNFIKCDLSKDYKNGTFNYYIIYFHKIEVDREADPNRTIERKVMDLNVINGFDKLLEQTKVISDRIKTQGWS